MSAAEDGKVPTIEVTDGNYTKYEIAQMVGVRALQISMGAPFAMEISDETLVDLRYNPIDIARLELESGKIPLKVLRPLPVPPSLLHE